jgi:hypothetical protein
MKRPDQLVIRQGSILRKSPFPPEDLGPNKDGLVAKGTETKTITPIGAKRDRAVEEAGAVETQPESPSGDRGIFQRPVNLRAGSFTQDAIGVLKNKNPAPGLAGSTVHLLKDAAGLNQHPVGFAPSQLESPVLTAAIHHDDLINSGKPQSPQAGLDAGLFIQCRYDSGNKNRLVHGMIVTAITESQMGARITRLKIPDDRRVFLTKDAYKKLHFI